MVMNDLADAEWLALPKSRRPKILPVVPTIRVERTFDAKRFAFRVKAWRAKLGCGLRDAAKKIGISAATLSRVERRGIPDLKTYLKIETAIQQ